QRVPWLRRTLTLRSPGPMTTATGPARPVLKAASLEPRATRAGRWVQRSRPVRRATTSCCPRTNATSGVPVGATAIMPSGTRAPSSAEAPPVTASATAVIPRNHLMARDYPQVPRASRAAAAFRIRGRGRGRPKEREMELCARIDEARRSWDVLKHPFYERWECGELNQIGRAHV